jgi:cobalt-zinc-cadmium efflux system outer membrane protein
MYSPPSVVSIGMARLLAALIAILIVMSAGLTMAQAASSDGPAFSVRAVYDSALALSPEAQSQKKRIEALMAKKESATAFTAQPLSLEGSYRSDRNYDNQGLREVELGFSAPLWNWNERIRTQSLRDSELQTANAQFEAVKLELAAEVRQVVWDTLSSQLDVEIAQTRAQAASKLTDDVKRRVDAGELAKTDLYQAQALHAQAKSEMGRAMAALSDMAIQFSELTGLPISSLQGVQAENAEIPQGLRPLDHPSLKAAQSQLHTLSRQTELTVTQKRANPELGLTVVSDRSAFGIVHPHAFGKRIGISEPGAGCTGQSVGGAGFAEQD